MAMIANHHLTPVSTHFLSLFLSRWCSSSPSDRFLSADGDITDSSFEPNQHTLTLPPPPSSPAAPAAAPASFPGHEGNPACGPHTTSPAEKERGVEEEDEEEDGAAAGTAAADRRGGPEEVEGDGERSESSEKKFSYCHLHIFTRAVRDSCTL